MDNPTQQLLNRFKHGDQSAFTELYHMLYQPVLFHARGLVELEQAEEATADAFYKLWLHRAGFDHLGGIRKWLRITVTNQCINILKSDSTIDKKHKALAYLNEETCQEAYFRDEAEFDLFEKIFKEIENLAPRQKDILKLYYLQKKTIAQIAAELHISEITVKQAKARALQLLKLKISPEELLAFNVFILSAASLNYCS